MPISAGRISSGYRPLGDLPVRQHHNLIRDLQDPLLMGDDDNRAVMDLLAHPLKDPDQVLEAPQVDSGLRLVKYGKLCLPGKHGRDLNSLQLSAGEGSIDFSVDIVLGAEPNLGQIIAGQQMTP